MDVLFGIGFAAFLIIGPWIVAFWALHHAKKNLRDSQSRCEGLESRLNHLDRSLQELRETFARFEQPTVECPPVSANAPERAVDEKVLVTAPPTWKAEPLPIQVAPPATEIVMAHSEPVAAEPPAVAAGRLSPAAEPALVLGSTPAAQSVSDYGLEAKVGTSWFSKIGTVLVVLGVAFLISTLMKTLGPAGKVLVGIAVGGSLLGAGSYFERNDRYRVLARAGIGGGWALLFFTAYAMHHVAVARVIESQTLDLILMMAVAAAMVWHTLRYNTQVVTGLAFLLAFVTINIGRGTVFSLTAAVVLGAALSFFVVRRRWFELEIFAILATYLNHWSWLRPIIEPMAGRHRMFPQFLPSALILCSYWFIFRLSYILRTTTEDNQENVSTISALLNGGLLLAVMRYQSVRPELAFWFLLGLGFAELLLAQLSITRRRRSAFVVLTVIGSALVVAAIPFRYSGMSLAVLWIAESQALLLAGIGTDEPVFRRLGGLAMVPAALVLVFHDAASATVAPDPKLAIVCGFAALACYADAEWFQRLWPRMFNEIFEGVFLKGLSYAGMILIMIAAWAGLHDAWVGIVWAVLGLALAFARNRLRIGHLHLGAQANILAAAALVRVFTVNIGMTGNFHAVGLRLLTVSCVAGLLYLSAPWTAIEHRGRIPAAYTWAASFLVALLAWYELRPISVALGWALFGLLLLELGLMRRMRDLTGQALVALAAAFTRIFFVNLNASAPAGQLSPRVYTVLPLALIFYYAYERLRTASSDSPDKTPKWQSAPALCWFGAISIAAVVRFELNADWVVAAWAAAALALLLASYMLDRRIFLHQALAVAFAVLFRGVMHNFNERSYFAAHWANGSQAVIVACGFLFASLPVAFALRKRLKGGRVGDAGWFVRALRRLESEPHQLLFFAPLALVTVLLALELRSGMITVAWGIEGVIVFVTALYASERSYRLAGLGLLLLCVGKILLIDVWQMQGTDRYLTLIVTGSALLLVSFLYSRYREAVKEYL